MAQSWWDGLSYREQKKYLEHHPQSKRKLTAAKPVRKPRAPKAAAVLKELPAPEPVPQPSKSIAQKATDFVVKNRKAIALALAPTLLGLNRKFDETMDAQDHARTQRDANLIQTALALGDKRVRDRLGAMMGLKTGAVLLGVLGVSVFTGIDLSLVLPLVASDFWDEVTNHRDPVTFMKHAGAAYFGAINKNLNNPRVLRQAFSTAKADVVVDDTTAETAALQVTSQHESDLNRALVRFERVPVAEFAAVRTPNTGLTVQALLSRVDQLETNVPKLASILVAAVPQRLSLSRRAKTTLTAYTAALDACRTRLGELASEAPVTSSPLRQLLRRKIAHTRHAQRAQFVRCETGRVQLAEVHEFERANAPPATVYGYYAAGRLHLATGHGNAAPRAFDALSARDVAAWLADTGLTEEAA